MQLITKTIFWIICLLYIPQPIKTARILAIISIPSYSHQIPYRPLWTTLSRKGHEVVLLTTDPINDPSLTNLTEISLQSTYKLVKNLDFAKTVMEEWFSVERKYMWPLARELIENIYKHPKVHKMYVPDSNKKFDIVIVEALFTPGLYALAHRFNAPLIGVSSVGLPNNNNHLLGAPVLPSHPSTWKIGDDTGFKLSLWQRINNFIRDWYHTYYILNYFYPEQQAIAEKYLGKNIPDISDIERNISIIFHNQQEAFSFVKPTTPNALTFGNFHISKDLPTLPKDLKEFVADAPNGFIYMSLGTNVRLSSFPKYVQSTFRDVFASLPYKVLWKLDIEWPDKPDNVYIAKWIPQQSILAHPNIRLFIYQGGLQSTEEAIYYTVPLLGLPILADQYCQVNKMVSLGVAKRLNIMDISRENLNVTIIDILSNERNVIILEMSMPRRKLHYFAHTRFSYSYIMKKWNVKRSILFVRYKKKMSELKALNEDKPYDLLEHVIWWIEFVIRHKGAPHLRTSIAHDPWYQKYEMDVIAILSIAMFITLVCILIIIYKLLKILFNLINMPIVKKKTN